MIENFLETKSRINFLNGLKHKYVIFIVNKSIFNP